jgi:2-oxoglutarate dehydrogenase E2 component (dihydrolipoamide succinyltransferase)
MLSSRDGAAAVGVESLAGRGRCGPDLRGTVVFGGADADVAAVATIAAEAPGAMTVGPAGAAGATADAADAAPAAEAPEAAPAAATFDAAPGIGKAVKPAATEAGWAISTAVGAEPITGAEASSVADAAAATAAAAAPGFCLSTR